MPSGAVRQHDGMCAPCDASADFIEMTLHGLGVSERQGKRGTGAAGGTDGAERTGRLIALIGGQAWPCASPGPDPGLPVLLTDPGFVLEPDLDGLMFRHIAQLCGERGGEVFLNVSIAPSSCFGCRGRPDRREKPKAFIERPT